MSILIVDDSQEVRLLLQTLLESNGYAECVVTAGSGEEALQVLTMDHSGGFTTSVDLILMDIMMPGIDGVETVRRIKAIPKLQDIPIMMVTGQQDSNQLVEAFSAGAMDYLVKPPSLVELVMRVRSAYAMKLANDQRKLDYHNNLEQKCRELAEEALAKTQILNTITHEINTPLTCITGYVEKMLMHPETVGGLNDRQQDYLAKVQRNARRLKAVLDSLMDASRMEVWNLKLDLDNLDVGEEIQNLVEAAQGLIEENRINVSVNPVPQFSMVRADRARLGQILGNLLSNACKYSAPDSSVTIQATEVGGMLQIDVADDGPGIPEVDQAKVFTKWFRADHSSTRQVYGVGLSLFVTRHLVEAHGGRIWLNSQEGRGSTFSFTLPLPTESPVRS